MQIIPIPLSIATLSHFGIHHAHLDELGSACLSPHTPSDQLEMENGIRPSKIYIIAGEASGDFLGSRLIEEMRILNHDIVIKGIGGSKMISSGLNQSLFNIGEISLMGFAEILPHLLRLRKLFNMAIADIIDFAPDALVTIDSPGFTFRIAKKIRKLLPSIKIIHLVAPSVWAYKPKRAIKYAKIYDLLLALLPFEPPYFEKEGLKTIYMGHPILEQKFYYDKFQARLRLGLNQGAKIILVTPGSRTGEIHRHMPIFTEALFHIAEEIDKVEVVFALADSEHRKIIDSYLSAAKFKVPKFQVHYCASEDKLAYFAASDVAIAKSGTNTLEIAASGTPLIVAYKLNLLTYWLIKKLIKIRYATLINIAANREIIPEFLQSDCNKANIVQGVINLLNDPKLAKTQIKDNMEVLEIMKRNGESPSKIAAKAILNEVA